MWTTITAIAVILAFVSFILFFTFGAMWLFRFGEPGNKYGRYTMRAWVAAAAFTILSLIGVNHMEKAAEAVEEPQSIEYPKKDYILTENDTVYVITPKN